MFAGNNVLTDSTPFIVVVDVPVKNNNIINNQPTSLFTVSLPSKYMLKIGNQAIADPFPNITLFNLNKTNPSIIYDINATPSTTSIIPPTNNAKSSIFSPYSFLEI